MTIKKILQKALESLGPNGENWAQETENVRGHTGKTCAYLAIQRTADSEWFLADQHFRKLLPASSGGSIVEFNDSPETTFEDVKTLFEKAIDSADRIDNLPATTVE